MSRRIKELEIKYTLRGFPYFIIEDKGGNKIKVQQSSTNLDDIMITIEESPFANCQSILLTAKDIGDIQQFTNWCKHH